MPWRPETAVTPKEPELLGSFTSDTELAAGAILIAELAVTLLHHATGESVQEYLQTLSLDLSRATQ